MQAVFLDDVSFWDVVWWMIMVFFFMMFLWMFIAVFADMIMRRDLSLSLKDAVFKVGFVFLMALVVFVLYNDISKILPSG